MAKKKKNEKEKRDPTCVASPIRVPVCCVKGALYHPCGFF
jgi:hypothetical protein